MKWINKTCPCGIEFSVTPSRKNSAKYCSHPCLAKYRPKKPAGYKCPKGALAKMGDKNPMFGNLKEDVGYAGLHDYIKKYLGKADTCEHCNEEKTLDLANKSQQYKRDLDDWLWLCRRCHVIYDDRMKYLELGRKKGKKFSEQARQNMSKAHLGKTPWNKGLKMSEYYA